MPKASGVYAIRHLGSGKRYVGSSVNLHDRARRHLDALRNGTHHSARLQAAWKRHGEDSFELGILELCTVTELLEREQFHLEVQSAYNVLPIARSSLGYKHTLATRRKMCESSARRWANMSQRVWHGLTQRGRKLSKTHRRKLSEAKLGNQYAVGHKWTPAFRARFIAGVKGRWRRERLGIV